VAAPRGWQAEEVSGRRTIVSVTQDISKLVEEARRLPEDDRIRLVEQILAMLEPDSDRGLAEAWSEEIARRSRRIEQGTVRAVPWSEVKDIARRRASGRR
jgi:putative addiction module component (TIGR02574 family)